MLRAKRRPRGTPDATRERLVAAAAELFERDGFAATDAGRIAREAGYAVGTFYKHFADKAEILLAAYSHWVDTEWREVEAELRTDGSPAEIAEQIVRLVLRLHMRWRGLRAALAALIASDASARRFHRAQRRRQLAMMVELRALRGAKPRDGEEDAILLFTLERVCDAIAAGELQGLALQREKTLGLLRDQIARAIEPA
jgi:AcrR family transcriptional regulator